MSECESSSRRSRGEGRGIQSAIRSGLKRLAMQQDQTRALDLERNSAISSYLLVILLYCYSCLHLRLLLSHHSHIPVPDRHSLSSSPTSRFPPAGISFSCSSSFIPSFATSVSLLLLLLLQTFANQEEGERSVTNSVTQQPFFPPDRNALSAALESHDECRSPCSAASRFTSWRCLSVSAKSVTCRRCSSLLPYASLAACSSSSEIKASALSAHANAPTSQSACVGWHGILFSCL